MTIKTARQIAKAALQAATIGGSVDELTLGAVLHRMVTDAGVALPADAFSTFGADELRAANQLANRVLRVVAQNA